MALAVGGVPIRRAVEYTVRREDWSKYEASDGEAIIWVRSILQKLFEIDIANLPHGTVPTGARLAPGPHYIVADQTVATAFFRTLHGPAGPTPIPPEELVTGGEVLRLTPLSEPWNEYLVTGTPAQIFSTRCIATRARLFRERFNAFGDPIVQVDSTLVIGPTREAQPGELGQ